MMVARCSIAMAILALASSATSAPSRVQITGIYSDLRYIKEAGDLVGTEVFIVNGGTVVYLQEAEGSPTDPVVAPSELNGNRITFSVPGSRFGDWDGVITKSGVDFSCKAAAPDCRPLHLPRKNSYWQG
ncbi:hypothetical protein BH11PSE2_BH11PSE2_14640 [soil metagenome]